MVHMCTHHALPQTMVTWLDQRSQAHPQPPAVPVTRRVVRRRTLPCTRASPFQRPAAVTGMTGPAELASAWWLFTENSTPSKILMEGHPRRSGRGMGPEQARAIESEPGADADSHTRGGTAVLLCGSGRTGTHTHTGWACPHTHDAAGRHRLSTCNDVSCRDTVARPGTHCGQASFSRSEGGLTVAHLGPCVDRRADA